MNLTQLIDIIKDIASHQLGVNSTYDGELYETWNTEEVKYGSFHLGVRNVRIDEQDATYTIIMYYGDRLLQDKSNRNAIWTDGTRVLNSVINTLNLINTNEVRINTEVRFEFFEQKFADYLAGVYVEVPVTVFNELGTCTMDGYEYHDDRDELIRQLEQRIHELEIEDAELMRILKEIRYKLNGTPIDE